MKTFLTFLAVTLLNGAFLYPLFFAGSGRRVIWPLVAVMAAGGVYCIYLLFRNRRSFR